MEKRFRSQDLSFMCKTYGAAAVYLLLFGWLVSVWEESLAVQLSGKEVQSPGMWMTWTVLAGELLLHLALVVGLLIWKRHEKERLSLEETEEFRRLTRLVLICNLAVIPALTLITWNAQGVLLLRLLPPFFCGVALAGRANSRKQQGAAWGLLVLSLLLAAVFPGIQYVLESFCMTTFPPSAALAAGWCSMVAYRLMPAVGYGLCALFSYRQQSGAGRGKESAVRF